MYVPGIDLEELIQHVACYKVTSERGKIDMKLQAHRAADLSANLRHMQ